MNGKQYFEHVASILGAMDKGSKYTVEYDGEYFIMRDDEDELDYCDWFEDITETDIINYILDLKGIDVNELEEE